MLRISCRCGAAGAEAHGDAPQAARLYGAADAGRAALGSPLLPEERARRARMDAMLLERLGEGPLARAAEGGGALEIPEASREALAALAVFGGAKPA